MMKIELGEAELRTAVAMYLDAKFHDASKFQINLLEVKGASSLAPSSWRAVAEVEQVLPDRVKTTIDDMPE